MRALFAGQQVLISLAVFGAHNDVDDGIDAGCQVDQDVTHDVDSSTEIHLFAQTLDDL